MKGIFKEHIIYAKPIDTYNNVVRARGRDLGRGGLRGVGRDTSIMSTIKKI